jgi:hypothetical protein
MFKLELFLGISRFSKTAAMKAMSDEVASTPHGNHRAPDYGNSPPKRAQRSTTCALLRTPLRNISNPPVNLSHRFDNPTQPPAALFAGDFTSASYLVPCAQEATPEPELFQGATPGGDQVHSAAEFGAALYSSGVFPNGTFDYSTLAPAGGSLCGNNDGESAVADPELPLQLEDFLFLPSAPSSRRESSEALPPLPRELAPGHFDVPPIMYYTIHQSKGKHTRSMVFARRKEYTPCMSDCRECCSNKKSRDVAARRSALGIASLYNGVYPGGKNAEDTFFVSYKLDTGS